jgi:hypothetical protein
VLFLLFLPLLLFPLLLLFLMLLYFLLFLFPFSSYLSFSCRPALICLMYRWNGRLYLRFSQR